MDNCLAEDRELEPDLARSDIKSNKSALEIFLSDNFLFFAHFSRVNKSDRYADKVFFAKPPSIHMASIKISISEDLEVDLEVEFVIVYR